MKADRRRFTRYAVEGDEFEVFSRELGINGKLKDISRGGMSYHYTPEAGISLEVVDILEKSSDCSFLSGLVCKKIYDVTELAAGRTFRGTNMRLRGLEFVALPEKQRQRLEGLLEKFGNGRSGNQPRNPSSD